MRFIYDAVDCRGRTTSGEVDADSREEASTWLRQQGMFPTNIKDIEEILREDGCYISPTNVARTKHRRRAASRTTKEKTARAKAIWNSLSKEDISTFILFLPFLLAVLIFIIVLFMS